MFDFFLHLKSHNFSVKLFSDTDANHLLNTIKNITKSLWTLKGRTTVYWQLTGTTTRSMLEFQCQFISRNPSNVFYTLPQKAMICTPQMDSASIWPKQSEHKSTIKHPTSWWKIHQRHTIEGRFISVLLTSSWCNHFTYFKWDSFLPSQNHSLKTNLILIWCSITPTHTLMQR